MVICKTTKIQQNQLHKFVCLQIVWNHLSDLGNYRSETVLYRCASTSLKSASTHRLPLFGRKNILSTIQFGFRKKRNTEFAFAICFLTSRDKIWIMVKWCHICELCKDFYSLSQAQILENLSSYFIHEREQQLLFFNRKQTVRFISELSESMTFLVVYPIRSILEHLLFVLNLCW